MKPCRKCGSTDRYGSRNQCRPCAKARARDNYNKNKEVYKNRARERARALRDDPTYRAQRKAYMRKYYVAHKEVYTERGAQAHIAKWPSRIVKSIELRATRAGVPFNLSATDIVVPAVCPVLGIPISFGMKWDNKPSVDRLIPDLGYVPGNVRVISYRANRLKSDATASELRAILCYVETELAA